MMEKRQWKRQRDRRDGKAKRAQTQDAQNRETRDELERVKVRRAHVAEAGGGCVLN